MSGKVNDITGMQHDHLKVIGKAGKMKHHSTVWLIQCDCGKVFEQTACNFLHTQSCGCERTRILKERMTKHGYAGRSDKKHERLYSVWVDMRRRCNTPSCEEYKWYGGKGVKVCDEWNDYSSFRAWAYENGYDENVSGHKCSIDRIDSNGNYEPSNCRWVDFKTQSRNHSRNNNLVIDGEVICIRDASKKYGISEKTINKRIKEWGLSDKEAVTLKKWSKKCQATMN